MAFYSNKSNVDLEKGNGQQLYPGMQENPQMRWGFIRKVYCILCLQLLVTFGVAIAMTLIQPVRLFLRTPTGLYVMIAAIVLTVVRKFLLLLLFPPFLCADRRRNRDWDEKSPRDLGILRDWCSDRVNFGGD